jgi:hypothetical protein
MKFVLFFTNGFIDAVIILITTFIIIPKLLMYEKPVISKKVKWSQVFSVFVALVLVSSVLHFWAQIPFITLPYLALIGIIVIYFLIRIVFK